MSLQGNYGGGDGDEGCPNPQDDIDGQSCGRWSLMLTKLR